MSTTYQNKLDAFALVMTVILYPLSVSVSFYKKPLIGISLIKPA